jgi:hypothetical protein
MRKHPVPYWSALAAGLGSIAGAIGATLLTGERVFQEAMSAVFTAIAVGAAVYAGERLREEKRKNGGVE